jgi:hypothetical protein
VPVDPDKAEKHEEIHSRDPDDEVAGDGELCWAYEESDKWDPGYILTMCGGGAGEVCCEEHKWVPNTGKVTIKSIMESRAACTEAEGRVVEDDSCESCCKFKDIKGLHSWPKGEIVYRTLSEEECEELEGEPVESSDCDYVCCGGPLRDADLDDPNEASFYYLHEEVQKPGKIPQPYDAEDPEWNVDIDEDDYENDVSAAECKRDKSVNKRFVELIGCPDTFCPEDKQEPEEGCEDDDELGQMEWDDRECKCVPKTECELPLIMNPDTNKCECPEGEDGPHYETKECHPDAADPGDCGCEADEEHPEFCTRCCPDDLEWDPEAMGLNFGKGNCQECELTKTAYFGLSAGDENDNCRGAGKNTEWEDAKACETEDKKVWGALMIIADDGGHIEGVSMPKMQAGGGVPTPTVVANKFRSMIQAAAGFIDDKTKIICNFTGDTSGSTAEAEWNAKGGWPAYRAAIEGAVAGHQCCQDDCFSVYAGGSGTECFEDMAVGGFC